jgi:hypothetical protein
MYLVKEGIDNRYSQLILKELHDATEMTDDQMNQAANELITTSLSSNIPANNKENNIKNNKTNVQNV